MFDNKLVIGNKVKWELSEEKHFKTLLLIISHYKSQ